MKVCHMQIWCTCHSLVCTNTAPVTATLTAASNGHFMLHAQYTNMEQYHAPQVHATWRQACDPHSVMGAGCADQHGSTSSGMDAEVSQDHNC